VPLRGDALLDPGSRTALRAARSGVRLRGARGAPQIRRFHPNRTEIIAINGGREAGCG
jgi:hypothetical protein